MTIKTSAIPDVLGYLFDTCTASVLLGKNPTNPVTVVYGFTDLSGNYPQQSLWIGSGDPTNPDMQEVATSDQAWVGAGARNRDENLTVSCYAEWWNGEGDLRAAAQGAFGIVAAVEQITVVDPSAGNTTNGFTKPGVTNQRLRIGADSLGVVAQVLFDFTAYARIGVL